MDGPSAVLLWVMVWLDSERGRYIIRTFNRTTARSKMVSCNGTALLLLLTRVGIPVSTLFLVLPFASTFVLEKMLMKLLYALRQWRLMLFGLSYKNC